MLGHQAVILYEEQPRTCALCHSVEHFRSECPLRRRTSIPNPLEQVPGSYGSKAGAARGEGKGPHTKDADQGEQAVERTGQTDRAEAGDKSKEAVQGDQGTEKNGDIANEEVNKGNSEEAELAEEGQSGNVPKEAVREKSDE